MGFWAYVGTLEVLKEHVGSLLLIGEHDHRGLVLPRVEDLDQALPASHRALSAITHEDRVVELLLTSSCRPS